MTLADRVWEAGGLSDVITNEECLTHDLQGQTVECVVQVDLTEPNGKEWHGERIIKIRMKRVKGS